MATKTKKKTKTKTKTPKKTDKKELSKLEQKALDRWWKIKKERVGPPKFKKIKDRTVTHVEQDPDKFWPQMMEVTGSLDIDFFKTIISQVSNTLPNSDSEEASNFGASFINCCY